MTASARLGEVATPGDLRVALPRAWGAFLARFGTPTPIQLGAASPLLAGRDALLCAPTASGKTEAYLAPLAERVPAGADGPPAVLVVSPTRALVNDLFRRVSPPLAAMGIGCGRWTGDAHDGGRLHPVTVLTPEALDSRLSRAPRQLDGVGALVMDELHVLDDTARGDQARVLVERLRAGRNVQVVAASATVPDPEALAQRYLRDAAVVQVEGRRRVFARIEEARSPIALARLLQAEVAAGFRKVLAFCDRREDVEVFARTLRGRPPFGDAVFAHHGSLARSVRLAAERRFLDAPAALCVATSTLELGIDIGGIDLVVLLGPPPDVPALVQRVGRGGRRADGVHVLAMADGAFRASVFRTLLAAQRDGRWLAERPVFRPGVLVQQALSVLHERPSRTVDAAALRRRLPSDLRAEWEEARLDAVLAHLAARGWLEPVRGGYGLGARAEGLWRMGRLHANLADRAEVTVTDALTGDVVGKVEAAEGGLGLGGRGRRVVSVTDERLVTEGADTWDIARFGSGGVKPTGPALARALLEGAGIPTPTCVRAAGHVTFFHGLGTAGGALLGEVFARAKVPVVRAGRFAVLLEEDTGVWPGPEAVRAAVRSAHAKIARSLDLGAWHGHLPPEEQQRAVAARCDVEAVAAALATRPPEHVPDDPGLCEEAAWA
ncbi:MAG: DEAD/DEAH box helicase [Myxococcota bacterium]